MTPALLVELPGIFMAANACVSCLYTPVTTRPLLWQSSRAEGCHTACRGQYRGSDLVRLAILKYAAVLGAAYVDVEYLAAEFFFASGFQLSISYLYVL